MRSVILEKHTPETDSVPLQRSGGWERPLGTQTFPGSAPAIVRSVHQ